jgi:NAD(P)H-hydrate epimerase
MKVVTSKQMRELDRIAIEDMGIPGTTLMENAGIAVVRTIEKFFPEDCRGPFAIFCGKGNNGGDGFVAARHLYNRGVKTKTYLFTGVQELKGDALVNFKIIEKMGLDIREIKDISALETDSFLTEASVIIDALLGTGLAHAPQGLLKDAIEAINRLDKITVAVDLPSGIMADSGLVAGAAVRADLTVTFALPKFCFFLFPAAHYSGRLVTADISIPRNLLEKSDFKIELVEREILAEVLRPRPLDAHKGSYGHVFILAGSPGKTGAAAMAATSTMRAGAGLVTLGVPKSLNPILEVKLDEAMTLPLPETDETTLGYNGWEKILEFSQGKTVMAIGPGLGTHPETVKLVQKALSSLDLPLVVDADGINALQDNPEIIKKAKGPVVLTPHPGELARLLGISTQELLANRLEIAQGTAQKWGVYLVLKGAYSLMASPGGEVFINPTGNPGMASGGTGDILTGMIAGFIAQKYDIMSAVKLGVYLHGLSGDLAAEALGEEYINATDLLKFLPEAFAVLKGEEDAN